MALLNANLSSRWVIYLASVDVKIKVTDVDKTISGKDKSLPVLRGVNFHVLEGEVVSILGPSGCGKTTLLNILAGLDEADTGYLNITGVPTLQRLGSVGYMQQKDLLLPWRSVLSNAILGLEVKGISKHVARTRALDYFEDFGLSGFEYEYPFALSGGMRQRVAFIRTILLDSDVLLLDEPFSALDALSRVRLQEWFLQLMDSIPKTVVLVTHDVEEAIFLSDRIYVMSARPGEIKEIVSIPFARPRDFDVVGHDSFVQLKTQLLSTMRGT